MAIRLTGEFQNQNVAVDNDVYTVDIYDADHVGAVHDIDIISLKILDEISDDGDIYSPVMGSRISIQINVSAADTTLTTFIEDFAYGEEGRFLVEVTKDTGEPIVWRGILTSDQSGEVDLDPFPFKLAGVCGLATLKKKPYHDGTTIYTGTERLSDHVITAMTKMSHVADFWTGSDVFLRTAIDWWAESMSSGADDDALYQAGANHSAFWDYKTTGGLDKDVISSWAVLEQIMLVLGCRIYQSEGHWRIDQIPYRSVSPYYTRDYDVSGTFISSAVNTGANVINNTRTGSKVTSVSYDFLPILKTASIIFETKSRRNLLNGYPFYSTTQKVDHAGGTAILRLRFTVHYKIYNDFYSGNANDILYLIPSCEVKIGDNLLIRGYSIANFTANLDPTSWDPTGIQGGTDLVYAPILLGKVPVFPTQLTGTFAVDVLTIPLPTSGDTLSFTPYMQDMAKWDGSFVDYQEFDITWSISDVSLEAYDNGTPSITEDEIEHIATNPADASERYEKSLRLGSAVIGNAEGRLFRWNGTSWVVATHWGQGVETRDDFISDILARNILNGQEGARRRLNGTLFGAFKRHYILQTTDGRKWIMTRGEWDLAQRTLSGSWVELDYGDTAVSSTPVKKYIVKGGIFTTTDPTGSTGQGISSDTPGFASNPAPAVLAPLAYNALDTPIEAGDVVTSIPIKTASAGSEFLAGDGVILVNPFTGKFQTFEIATAPTAGATSLSITSEASLYDFPEDSFLVVSQKPYAFSLPTGATGDYLYFNGTEWVAQNFDEDAQDAVGTILVDSTTVDFTYTDGTPSITAAVISQMSITADASGLKLSGDSATPGNTKLYGTDGSGVKGWYAQPAGGVSDGDKGDITVSGSGATWTVDNDVVTFAKMQNISTDKLLGRDTAATGDVEEIGLGASLAFDGAGNIQRAALTGDVTAAANGNATTIANDAVTYAKMQNVSATTRWLGRITAGAGDVEELTLANMYTMLGLTGTANRFALWTGANVLGSDAARTFTQSPDRNTFTGSAAGTGANNGIVNINTGAITGATEFLRMSGNITGNMIMSLLNANNLANSNTIFQMLVGGAVAADPVIQFTVSGVVTHAIGIDNSDLDKFKITPNSATPGGNANSGLIITNALVALVGINKDAPAHPLDVAGRVRSNEFIGLATDEPTVGTLGNGLGGGAAINDVTGTNNGFSITFTTGIAPVAGGNMFVVTYKDAYPGFAIPVFSQLNDNAAGELTKFSFAANNGGGFTMKVRAGQTLTASTQYALNFAVNGF